MEALAAICVLIAALLGAAFSLGKKAAGENQAKDELKAARDAIIAGEEVIRDAAKAEAIQKRFERREE